MNKKIQNPQVFTKKERKLLKKYARLHSEDLKLKDKLAIKLADSKALKRVTDIACIFPAGAYLLLVIEMVKHNISNTNTNVFVVTLMGTPLLLLGGTFHGLLHFNNKLKSKQEKLLDLAKKSKIH